MRYQRVPPKHYGSQNRPIGKSKNSGKEHSSDCVEVRGEPEVEEVEELSEVAEAHEAVVKIHLLVYVCAMAIEEEKFLYVCLYVCTCVCVHLHVWESYICS